MKKTERRVERSTSTAIFVAQLERYGRTTRALGDAVGDRIRAEVTRRVHAVFPAKPNFRPASKVMFGLPPGFS